MSITFSSKISIFSGIFFSSYFCCRIFFSRSVMGLNRASFERAYWDLSYDNRIRPIYMIEHAERSIQTCPHYQNLSNSWPQSYQNEQFFIHNNHVAHMFKPFEPYIWLAIMHWYCIILRIQGYQILRRHRS